MSYIFDRNADGTLNYHPITNKDELDSIQKEVTSIWQQQGLVGTVIHDAIKNFYKSGENLKDKPLEKQRELIIAGLTKYSEAYTQLRSKFKNGIMDETKIVDSVINAILDFDKQLHSKFGNNCRVLSEAPIKGVALVNGKPRGIIGRTDMIVITDKGDVSIIDYKCSPKEYGEYDPAKRLTFNYQLAVYRKILNQLGINPQGKISLYVCPFKFEGFDRDKSTDRVTFDKVTWNTSDIFNELEASNPMSPGYETVEGNLYEMFPPKPKVDDLNSSDIIKTVDKFHKDAFPSYNISHNITSEKLHEQLLAEKRLSQNETTKQWELRDKRGRVKNTYNTEQEAVLAAFNDIQKTNQFAQDKIEALKRDIIGKEHPELIKWSTNNRRAEDKDWTVKFLAKYTQPQYEALEDDDTTAALEQYGIILIKNKLTRQIDVIKLSNASDLTEIVPLGDAKRNHTLFGHFQNDYQANKDPENKAMESTIGNIELMETMAALDCIPNLFARDMAQIGNIQVISTRNNMGTSAPNEQLLYNYLQLRRFTKMEGDSNYAYKTGSTGVIKMSTYVDQVAEELHNIEIFRGKDKRFADADVMSMCPAIFQSLGNPNLMKQKLIMLQHNIEKAKPSLAQGFTGYSYYDDDTDPLRRLYNKVILAIGELNGLNYYQQVRDHAKFYDGTLLSAITWNGVNGTLTDNPGTMKSDTLNQISHLVEIGFQRVREHMFSFRNSLNTDYQKLKKNKGGGSLFNNMYDEEAKQNGDLIFKNPFEDDSLTQPEKEFLINALIRINSKRIFNVGDVTDEISLKNAISENRNLALRVPIVARAGEDVGQEFSQLRYSTRGIFTALNPKNWFDMAKMKENLNTQVSEAENRHDESVDASSKVVWEMGNSFDMGENEAMRAGYISQLGGINHVEQDLELILLKFEYADTMQKELNKVFPSIKALAFHLNNQGIIANKHFTQDLTYIANYVKAKIQNRILDENDKLGKLNKAASGAMRVASFLTLAFNTHQLYQFLDGFWKDIRLIITKPGDKEAFSFKNFKDAFMWVVEDSLSSKFGKKSLGEALNAIFGLNDMDMSVLAERLSHGENKFMRFAYLFASRPDYYNRLTIFVAQMKADGCFDACSVDKEGNLVYDWKKDKRFDVLAKYNGKDNNVSPQDKAKFYEQQGLYIAMAKEMVQDGSMTSLTDKNGNLLPLTKPYTTKQSESIKALCDKTYGYYSSEKKSMIQSFTSGQLFMQMATYWSSKKNQYLSGRVITQEGKYVKYVDNNGDAWYLKPNEDGTFIPTKENTGIPLYVWQGRPQEGIIITVNHMLYDMVKGNSDENHKGIAGTFKFYWHNEDPYLEKMYRANLLQLLLDLIGTLFIGGLVAGGLSKAANEYSKNNDTGTFTSALENNALLSLVGMFDASTDDFNAVKSIAAKSTNMTPFSISLISQKASTIWNWMVNDKDGYDTLLSMMSVGREYKPIANYAKVELLGRKIGDNGKNEE